MSGRTRWKLVQCLSGRSVMMWTSGTMMLDKSPRGWSVSRFPSADRMDPRLPVGVVTGLDPYNMRELLRIMGLPIPRELTRACGA